ncbi:29592_t:CDS:2 [Gigaspora margarita]|uniref:29592_t:CDS:1 n=1 Tax=Gigaspora margarita TaxID=4874 RepID=A0ABN7UFU9_GIGMA|nr:29592_t:CDS:2 [Gigaspora margarita]
MNSYNFVLIEESDIFPNIESNNGITVFIPQGYSPILIHEDATKKLKTIEEFSELRIHSRQISKIAGNKWNKLSEFEKSRYKLQSERLRMQYKSKNLKCKYKTRKQNLLKNLSILFRSII